MRRKILRADAGIYLTKPYLEELRPMLKGQRIFYVLSMNCSPGIFKFGVASAYRGAPHIALQRLKSYLIAYGAPDRRNSCAGVRVHYLEYTAYSEGIHYTSSRIYKIERNVIRVLRAAGELDILRGEERTKRDVALQRIVDIADKTVERDERPPPRRYPKRRRGRRRPKPVPKAPLRPREIVSAKAWTFGEAWAKEKFGDDWKSSEVKGVVQKVLDDGRVRVLWDGDDEPLVSESKHLRRRR